jgi:hypothetical protein
MTDSLEKVLATSIERYEQYLADPSLDPYHRSAYERLLDDTNQKLADHRTNAQLWANVLQARVSRDAEKVARNEQQLADYLAARMGKIRGKPFPPGTSLSAVMKEYRTPRRFVPRQVILTTLILLTISPLAIIAVLSLRARRVRRLNSKADG